jgi:hypothetical protein
LPGFFIQSTACFLLFIAAATGVIMHFDARLMPSARPPMVLRYNGDSQVILGWRF